MKDFEDLIARNNGIVSIQNLSGYTLLGKGRDGSVYQISEEWCVKVYKKEEIQKLELHALEIGQVSPVIPRLYGYGTNYIVMELVKGPSLKECLRKEKRMSEVRAKKILFMLEELKKAGFTRHDAEVRHIFFNEMDEIKVIDLKRAMTTERTYPAKLLHGLKEIGFMHDFLEHIIKLRFNLYKEWESQVPYLF